MEINPILKEFIEERFYEVQDATGLSSMLCCQSYSGTFHACLSQNINGIITLDDREIESVVKKYFSLDSCYYGEIYFNLLSEDWDKLERKLKIQIILKE